MRLAMEWVRELTHCSLESAEIADKLTMAGLEVEATETLGAGEVLVIKVTPNRGDCLSAVGTARELAAAIDAPLLVPPDSSDRLVPGDNGQFRLTVHQSDLCPRYAACTISDVRPGAVPDWIRTRLEAAGMRSLGGIVDVTNYVMLEMGQPLHAFDLDRLRGSEIQVRLAVPGETLRTLDGVERALTGDMLVIADADRPVALAGIMGGSATEMTARTRTALLESAHFNPISVRRTARALGLRTEASDRFERVVNPAGVDVAMRRACMLISEFGLGNPEHVYLDMYAQPEPPRAVRLRTARAAALLGFDLSADQCGDALRRLGFSAAKRGDDLDVTVPTWRADVVGEEDLVEEVGRVIGYQHIPERLPRGFTTQGRDSTLGAVSSRIQQLLVGAGLQEVVCHTLVAESELDASLVAGHERIPVRSALSAELSGLRMSLLPGLASVLVYNSRRGQLPLAFFEVGRTFSTSPAGELTERLHVGAIAAGPLLGKSWATAKISPAADFFTMKGLLERLMEGISSAVPTLATSVDPRFHPGRRAGLFAGGEIAGVLGELHPALAAGLHVRDRVIAMELVLDLLLQVNREPRFGASAVSPFPSVIRDLAPRISNGIVYAEVEAAIRTASDELLEGFALTDLYEGAPLAPGTRSLTLSMTFRSQHRTLTDAEVETAVERIRRALQASCGAEFQSG